MKNRLKNYNFWISMFSAVLLILQALKIEFDIAYVNEIFTAVLGLLVVVGIIIDPTKTAVATKLAEDKKTIEKPIEKEVENKVETKSEEVAINENVSAEQEEKAALPIVEKNETRNFDYENDIKIVLNKISADLENKISELGKFLKPEAEEERNIIDVKSKEEESSPAVAEMENPYIDLMK